MGEVTKKPASDFDAAVRILSGGTNVAIYNDLGLPSVFVRKDKGLLSDVIETESTAVHPAFRVNLAEIDAFYMGKYLATVYNGCALSLPFMDPAANTVPAAHRGAATSNYVNFNNAKIWCEANGQGFHLPTIAEYAWIALQSRRRGTMPRGNNNYGADYSAAWEKGIGSTFDSSNKVNRTLTGSGPATWNDNWKPDGICDLNGNVYECQGGYRTVDGEIQIFADNDAAAQYEQNPESTRWKAILEDGTLVAPGTSGSLKWDYNDGTPSSGTGSYGYRLNTQLANPVDNDTAYGSISFASLAAAAGVTVPEILKALALMPDGSAGGYGSDSAYMRNRGERLVWRGGNWNGTSYAGVFYAYGFSHRSHFDSYIGFRPAFIPGI
jgi:hypothetical protein